MNDPESHDIDRRLELLEEKRSSLYHRAHMRSATRVSREIRRLAKTERRLIPYLRSTFDVMNQGADLLDPETTRDCAIELISLLESEDRARAIQPDLPESEYEYTVHWMSACAYDNLAKGTALILGYNSEGTHACIAEGIAVCRRTGKLE